MLQELRKVCNHFHISIYINTTMVDKFNKARISNFELNSFKPSTLPSTHRWNVLNYAKRPLTAGLDEPSTPCHWAHSPLSADLNHQLNNFLLNCSSTAHWLQRHLFALLDIWHCHRRVVSLIFVRSRINKSLTHSLNWHDLLLCDVQRAIKPAWVPPSVLPLLLLMLSSLCLI